MSVGVALLVSGVFHFIFPAVMPHFLLIDTTVEADKESWWWYSFFAACLGTVFPLGGTFAVYCAIDILLEAQKNKKQLYFAWAFYAFPLCLQSSLWFVSLLYVSKKEIETKKEFLWAQAITGLGTTALDLALAATLYFLVTKNDKKNKLQRRRNKIKEDEESVGSSDLNWEETDTTEEEERLRQ